MLKASESNKLTDLKKLLPKSIQSIGIKSATAEIKTVKSGKIKVNIGNNINITDSYVIPLDQDNLDKTGHPSYKFLKSISLSLME